MRGGRQWTLGMQVLEHRARAREGQRAGTGEHLALEHRPQLRPVVGERRLPVDVQRVGEPVDHLARTRNEGVPRRGRASPRVGDVCSYDGGLRGADPLDLVSRRAGDPWGSAR